MNRYDTYVPPEESRLRLLPLRPIRGAGGLTLVGLAVAFLIAVPVVAGGILLAWAVT